jgi:hypothetical protein
VDNAIIWIVPNCKYVFDAEKQPPLIASDLIVSHEIDCFAPFCTAIRAGLWILGEASSSAD